MVKIVPQADAKSASMGWFFDPGFIQKVQRIAADVENPSMESIDSVLFALREMGYIKIAPYRGEDMIGDDGFGTTEHAMRELQAENAALLARHNTLVERVAWERECISAEIIWKDRNESSYQEWIGTVHAARAEVDRLIADCEGEG